MMLAASASFDSIAKNEEHSFKVASTEYLSLLKVNLINHIYNRMKYVFKTNAKNKKIIKNNNFKLFRIYKRD